MPSASAPIAAGALALLLAGLAAGCATTRDRSARSKVKAERALAIRKAVVVRATAPDVIVESASLVRGAGGSAIAVRLRNRGSRPVHDLPISVGLRSGDRERLLNDRRNLSYFQTHAPAIAPGSLATWVFSSPRALHGRPFARVAAAPTVKIDPAGALPGLRLRVSATGRSLAGTIDNPTGVPQYALELYAVATRGGRVVAAGRGVVPRVGGGKQAAFRIALVGRPEGAAVHVDAPPTVYR